MNCKAGAAAAPAPSSQEASRGGLLAFLGLDPSGERHQYRWAPEEE
jgi:hypothetical protein